MALRKPLRRPGRPLNILRLPAILITLTALTVTLNKASTAILISGNGVVLAYHTCLALSIKKVSLYKEFSCCSKDARECNSCSHNEKESFSSQCCSSEITYHKIDPSFLPQKSIQLPVINLFSFSIFSFNFLFKNKFVFYHFVPLSFSSALPFLFHQLLI